MYFAPRFYQGVGGLGDFITAATYDQDWSALNNWENLGAYSLKAYVYVSAIEDANRYFLFYGVFHPRDWCDWVGCSGFCGTLGCDYHENDLEGVMLTVDKRLANSTWPFGQVVTAETVYHDEDYHRYYNCYPDGWTNYVAPAGDFGGGQWTGCFTFHTVSVSTSPNPPGRIGVYIQTRGHGQFIIPGPVTSWNDGAGVVYDPSGTSPPVVPTYPFSGTQNATYRLQWLHKPDQTVPTASLWSKRFDTSHHPFLPGGATVTEA